jgi:uncharacterized protein YuzE
MATPRILKQQTGITWDYDEEADVLYLSMGPPRPALGVDIGDGTILRYDETREEVVGLTVVGVKSRLTRSLEESS